MKIFFIYLSYLGTIPFIFCSICFVNELHFVPYLGSTEKILSGYGLVITSFMAGSHWGQHLNINSKWNTYLPILSNMNAVLLCLSFLIFSFKTLLIIFMCSFLILILIDSKLFRESLISYAYFKARCSVTLIVIISLIFSTVNA